MTTVAFDGTTLAGDTLGTIGDTLRMTSQKIFLLDDGRLYGGSGAYEDVLAVRDWLNGIAEKPKVEHFAAIVISASGCHRYENALIPLPIQEPFHAVGSGRDFAFAAMALGRSAAEAVALAAQWDIWTGGEIQTLPWKGQPDGSTP